MQLQLLANVTMVLIFTHLFNKEIKKYIARVKTIETLRHIMTLAQEAENKLKRYEGLNNDDHLSCK